MLGAKVVFKTETLQNKDIYFALDVTMFKLILYSEREIIKNWINENTAYICDDVINIIVYGRYLWTEGEKIDAKELNPCY